MYGIAVEIWLASNGSWPHIEPQSQLLDLMLEPNLTRGKAALSEELLAGSEALLGDCVELVC